jgi:hypothetical protein
MESGGGGVLFENAEARSPDGRIRLLLPRGSKLTTKEGAIGTYLEVAETPYQKAYPPPDGWHIIGQVYDAGPVGTIIQPSANLRITYDKAKITGDIDENQLVIALWNAVNSNWTPLDGCVLDTATSTIAAPLGRLYPLAVVICPPKPPNGVSAFAAPTGAADKPSPIPTFDPGEKSRESGVLTITSGPNVTSGSTNKSAPIIPSLKIDTKYFEQDQIQAGNENSSLDPQNSANPTVSKDGLKTIFSKILRFVKSLF